jgi:hypothetical protein
MENLKLDLNLKLGLDLQFSEMNVHYTPLADGEGVIAVDVPYYSFVPERTFFRLNSVTGRYELVSYNEDTGDYTTAGLYLINPAGLEPTNIVSTFGQLYKFNSTAYDNNNWIAIDLTDYTNSLLEGIYNDVEHELKKFNSQVDKINDVNNIEGKVQAALQEAIDKMGINIYSGVSDFISKYINRANNIIDRLNYYGNKTLDYLINDPDRYVQPILLSYSNGKLTLVGRSRLGASVANANDLIALQPTTTTLETVAPAFKKHLAISNVYNNKTGKNAVYDNDAAAKGVMTAANQAIGATEVIDGGTQEGIHTLKPFAIPASAKSGMVFEIVYTALGYDGKIAGKKFYIRVK